MRLQRAYSILASLLLITTLMVAAGCQDEELPGLVGSVEGGRNSGKNASPSPSPTATADGKVETPPPSHNPSQAPNVTPQSLTLTPTTYSVNGTTGGGMQLGVQIKMSDNSTNTNPNDATWSSSNTSRATVSNGWVTVPAGASAGTVIITATAKGSSISGTATITVSGSQVENPTVQSVAVTPSTHTFSASTGGTVQLYATVTMSNQTTNSNVTWSSSNTSRATVNSAGLVTVPPGSTSDTVTITATATGTSVSGSATITISASQPPSVQSVAIQSTKDTITGVGPEGYTSAAKLEGVLTMTGGSQQVSDDLDWNSSNTNIATINSTGWVSVLPGVVPGTYSLTFTGTVKGTQVSGTKTISITVIKTLKSIAIDTPTHTTLYAGGQNTVQLAITRTMSDDTTSTDQSGVVWTSNNVNRAAVNSSTGLVTVPVNATTGSVTITATLSGKTAQVLLQVLEVATVSSVSVTPGTATINAKPQSGTPGAGFKTEQQLTATVTMSSGPSHSNVVWTSSNTNRATVSSTGLVTAPFTAMPGTVTIRATAEGGKYGEATITVTTDGRVNIIVD